MWPKIVLVAAVCLLVNLPMGRMRERSRKFSWQWIAWIHASIPLIVVLRLWLKLPWVAIPINIAAAVAGQFLGGLPEKKRRRAASPTVSSAAPRGA